MKFDYYLSVNTSFRALEEFLIALINDGQRLRMFSKLRWVFKLLNAFLEKIRRIGRVQFSRKFYPFYSIRTRWAVSAICFHCGTFYLRNLGFLNNRRMERQIPVLFFRTVTTYLGSVFWLHCCFSCTALNTVKFLPLILSDNDKTPPCAYVFVLIKHYYLVLHVIK